MSTVCMHNIIISSGALRDMAHWASHQQRHEVAFFSRPDFDANVHSVIFNDQEGA